MAFIVAYRIKSLKYTFWIEVWILYCCFFVHLKYSIVGPSEQFTTYHIIIDYFSSNVISQKNSVCYRKKITADVFPSHWADKSKAKKTFKGCDIMVELVGVLFQNRKQAFTFVPPHTIKKKFVVDFEIDFDHSYTKVGIIYKRTS